MKITIRSLTGAAAFMAAVTLHPLAFGQAAVSQTTTTTSAGTVTEFSPDTVVVHSEGSTAPLRYSYTKSTTVVDENGNPVDISVVKSGVPVQVYYDREGDGMVARKIIVRRIHRDTTEVPAVTRDTTTTTTTTEGRDHDHDHDHDHDR